MKATKVSPLLVFSFRYDDREPPQNVFDTVIHSALLIILGKLGCPPQFVEMLKQLHGNMKVRRVNVNGHFLSQSYHRIGFQFS